MLYYTQPFYKLQKTRKKREKKEKNWHYVYLEMQISLQMLDEEWGYLLLVITTMALNAFFSSIQKWQEVLCQY